MEWVLRNLSTPKNHRGLSSLTHKKMASINPQPRMGVRPNQPLPSWGDGMPSKGVASKAAGSKPTPKVASGVRKHQQARSVSAALHAAIERSRVEEEKRRAAEKNAEKRVRRFRNKPPQSFYPIYQRATSQRFFVLDRIRCGTEDCPEEKFELAGSTGNVYKVHIGRRPECNCPHAFAGNQCKHLLYVMSRVLRAKFNLVYQLALLSSELREILDKAPRWPSAQGSTSDEQRDHNRKPVEGDCPICFEELAAATDAAKNTVNSEQLVWCRAACGQNMHRQCFQIWSATKRQHDGGSSPVTCPLCRSVWEGEADDSVVKNLKKDGPLNRNGYVNVADQLGISPVRDYSTYSLWWGRERYPSRSGRRGHH
ncbi:Znf1 [Gaeumannomyces tritici R3-111a-1]|uniref:Znf1 n=1 Tax=Gaeumannomyces tritici (strain R3-111a-1) TaxID=644352 RepID=J3NUN8_GAET3|nr:Znf1 [Gaeumannomyces tritici R3-111a-1]EJT79912.1 Znf1 [Gaeumannomyces tritici R3-111a-1]